MLKTACGENTLTFTCVDLMNNQKVIMCNLYVCAYVCEYLFLDFITNEKYKMLSSKCTERGEL